MTAPSKPRPRCGTVIDEFTVCVQRSPLPHCSDCHEHHTAAVTCEQVAAQQVAERRAGWDPSP